MFGIIAEIIRTATRTNIDDRGEKNRFYENLAAKRWEAERRARFNRSSDKQY